MAWIASRGSRWSFTWAAAITAPGGPPSAATSTLSLVPFFPRSVGSFPTFFPPKRALPGLLPVGLASGCGHGWPLRGDASFLLTRANAMPCDRFSDSFLAFRRLQPQPDEVPPALRLGVVLEGGAVVQDPAVVNEDHVPRLQRELDPQVGPVQHLVQNVQRSALRPRERLARLLVPHLDPVAQVAIDQP